MLGLTKVWAIVSGLLNLKGANEWVVTAKTGVGEDAKTGELDATGEPDAAAEDAYNSDESNEATYSPAPNGQNSRTCQRILGDHLVGQDEQVVSRRFTVSLEQSSQAPVTKHRRGAPSALGSSPLREAASAGTERLSPTGGPGESESSSRKGWRWPGIDPRAERRFSKPLPRVFCIRWRRMRAGFRSFWAKRKVHGPELVVAAWCLGAACAGSVMGGARSVLFLWMQGGAALAVALDLIVW